MSTKKQDKIQIEYIPSEDLIPYARNPRKNDSSVDELVEIINLVGFINPIIVDKNNEIICGHTRLKACKKIGMESIPCIRAENLNEDQIKAYRILDNKASELSTWNEDLLSVELSGIKGLDLSPFDFGDISIEEESKPQKKNTKPYEWFHVLITLPSNRAEEVAKIVKWAESKGYEYEQSNN